MRLMWAIMGVISLLDGIDSLLDGLETGDKGVMSWSVICCLVALASFILAGEDKK